VRSLIEEGKKAAAEPMQPSHSIADDHDIPAPGGEVMPEPAHE